MSAGGVVVAGKVGRDLKSKVNHIKQRLDFYLASPYLANIILNENKIKIENG